ncbi:MAG: type II toxin-antitoxin system death-on-curing family toxin [Pseudomonadota bacterium]
MSEFKWLRFETIRILHDESLFEHGGLEGIRDEGLLESALMNPQNKAHYDQEASVFEVAAANAYALAKNHPFLDGNKRTAFLAAATFLMVNNYRLGASEADATLKVLGLAASEISESEFAKWLRENSEAT